MDRRTDLRTTRWHSVCCASAVDTKIFTKFWQNKTRNFCVIILCCSTCDMCDNLILLTFTKLCAFGGGRKGLRWCDFASFLVRFFGFLYFILRYCGFCRPRGLRFFGYFDAILRFFLLLNAIVVLLEKTFRFFAFFSVLRFSTLPYAPLLDRWG